MTRIALLALAVPAAAIAAAAPVELVSSVLAEKTETVAGRQQIVLRAPARVVPGDKLVFQTSYRNNGAKPAAKVVVTNPVPNGVAYAGVATPGAVMSVDGGRSFGPLATLTVKGANGQPRGAQAEDVTTLRWTVASIAPGGAGVLQYRGIVR